jgi:3-oxoacyl-[acyl-carrier protein] reductase
MDLRLKDKVALVTGGARGLGKAVCRALAAEGACVAINYRSHAQEAEDLARELRESHRVDALALGADVAREDEVGGMFDNVVAHFGRLDVLVNNAALCPTCGLKDMSLARWSETVDVNLTGTFLTSREMVRRLTEVARPGRIVNISSTAAYLGSTTGHAPYDASKGGIISFTISLAREVARQGIAVNAVAPGMMVTEMTADTLAANREKYLARIPIGRIGDPEEVASVVVFLASDRASYMTGTVLNVSGGLLMG